MTLRARILAGLGAALVLAGAFAGAAQATKTAAAAGPLPPLASAELVAPGLVEAEHDVVSLAFDGSGRVAEILVAEGDHVAAGDLVARLDDRLQRAGVAKASAALAAAEARASAAAHGARPAEIAAANAEADAARAHAEEQTRQAARAADLHASGAIGASQLDGEQSAAAASRATADAAGARLSLLREGTRAEQRREAAATVEAARADLEDAKVRLAQTELRAPTAGTVLRRLIEPGTLVTTMPPTVVVTIADLAHVRLRAEVDEADIPRVAVGQRATLTASALGGERVTAHVIRLERELGRKKIRTDDPRARIDTRVLEVLLDVDPTKAPLPLGLRADVHFALHGDVALAQGPGAR